MPQFRRYSTNDHDHKGEGLCMPSIETIKGQILKRLKGKLKHHCLIFPDYCERESLIADIVTTVNAIKEKPIKMVCLSLN